MDEIARRMTVHIVDGDASVRDALARGLSLRGHRAAVFACAEDLLGAIDAEAAGCVLVELRLSGMGGLELLEALAARGPDLPVIVVMEQADAAATRRAFKAGAVDVLQKPLDEAELAEALAAAFTRERARLEALAAVARRVAALAALSPREREVLDLLQQGMDNRAIAVGLGISPRTVEVHKARVMEKLGARSLNDLIRLR